MMKKQLGTRDTKRHVMSADSHCLVSIQSLNSGVPLFSSVLRELHGAESRLGQTTGPQKRRAKLQKAMLSICLTYSIISANSEASSWPVVSPKPLWGLVQRTRSIGKSGRNALPTYLLHHVMLW